MLHKIDDELKRFEHETDAQWEAFRCGLWIGGMFGLVVGGVVTWWIYG
jgi:hypothetical protein